MLDGNLLKYYISRKSNLRDIATVLDINQATLSRKINGHNEFTRDEINKLKDYLNLSVEEMNNIFFSDKLA